MGKVTAEQAAVSGVDRKIKNLKARIEVLQSELRAAEAYKAFLLERTK